MKKPRRIYGSRKENSVYDIWLARVHRHGARLLKNGENPTDFPTEAVAYETPNFGWILSEPDGAGKRRILDQF